MPLRKGFLLVTMEPPPVIEEEFNDWYDTEHVPERLALPGFESARRYVCMAGWPRYLALYDLQSAAVIDSPGYQGISGERFSPWTRRVLARVRGFYRAYGEQVYPGNASTVDTLRTLLIRFRGITDAELSRVTEAARSEFERRPEVRQVRVLRDAASVEGDVLLVIGVDSPASVIGQHVTAFGSLSHRMELVNEYVAMPRLGS